MSGRLPSWLVEWVGVSTPADADGATWQLDSAWGWPPWATLLLILALALITALLYVRESSGAGRGYRALLVGLRWLALAILLVMLAQWALALRLTGPPTIALVVDRSASMGVADRYSDAELPGALRERLVANGRSEPTRLNLAKLLLTENDGRLVRELAQRYRLEVYFAAGGVERFSDAEDATKLLHTIGAQTTDGPDSGATRLGDAVRHVLADLRGEDPAAIILLTDGVTTDGVSLPGAAEDARRAGVPLVAVGLGSGEPPRDIELADVLVDDAVFVDDPVTFEVQVKAANLQGERAVVTLRLDGDSEALAEESVELPPDGHSLTVRLVHRPTQPGSLTYVVDVAAREDETNRDNNRQKRVVEVRDEKIRVLLTYGYPSYEFRFLKTLFERDPTVEVAAYLQAADPEHSEQDKTALRSFPVSRDELFEYDVLVIGDVDPRLLPRGVWQNVGEFVAEKGGGVAFVAGPRNLPWLFRDNVDVAALLPIIQADIAAEPDGKLPSEVSSGFVVRPTPLGLQSSALQLGDTPAETEQIWRGLPPLYWLYQVDALKPAAQILAVGPTGPVICFQYVGAGRVLFHAIDSTWRWRIGAGDAYFARYWIQSVRFLARTKLTSGRGAQLTADRREYRRGEPIELRLRFLDARVAPAGGEAMVSVESPGQPRRRVPLSRNPAVENVFEASLADLPEGRYEVLLVDPALPGAPATARFSVVAPPGELARLEMDAAALSAAAKTSGGKFYTLDDADRLLENLPAGHRVPIENLPPMSLWNRWWMIGAFLATISAEWILRKRKGML